MQDKLTSWFFGLPVIVVILVLAIVAILWFGVRYLNRREAFWMEQNKSKDILIKDIIDKIFNLYNDAITRETTVMQELNRMQQKIDEWFRRWGGVWAARNKQIKICLFIYKQKPARVEVNGR